jgi:hypothetical protein
MTVLLNPWTYRSFYTSNTITPWHDVTVATVKNGSTFLVGGSTVHIPTYKFNLLRTDTNVNLQAEEGIGMNNTEILNKPLLRAYAHSFAFSPGSWSLLVYHGP